MTNITRNVEIIAELAQGFEGKPEQTHLLLRAAARAGATAVKYQLVYADELATPDYQYYDLFKTLEMPDEFWHGLAKSAADQNIQLNLDIFGIKSLKLAEEIGVKTVKVHGTDISNIGFLEEIAKSNIDRVLLGAGGAFNSEIDKAIQVLSNKKVNILLGFQSYPTPNETNQIARVKLLNDKYKAENKDITVGFADHAPPESPLRFALAAMAVGAGATIIEKHLTLGKVMELEDHESALNPDEFKEFTTIINGCAEAYGSTSDADDFDMSTSEMDYRRAIRRNVITAMELAEGTELSPENLVLKRSSAENALTDISETYGKKLKRTIAQNHPLLDTDIDR